MLAHVPSSGRNPRGSSAFLAYPVPKACIHVLGTGGSEVLGCRTLRLESQSSAGLGMQPYPRAPDLVWPGHLHGNGCLSARAMDTGFPTVVWRVLFLGMAVFCPKHTIIAHLRGSSNDCCSIYRCVMLVSGSGFRGNAANPGWGLGCVCLGTCFDFAPPFLAGVCGVCSWARVLDCSPQWLAGVLARVWL